MKTVISLFAGSLLAVVPLFAHASSAYGSQWSGPYLGAQVGFNQSSAHDLDTELAPTGGVLGGYNGAIATNTGTPVIVGGDLYVEFNGQASHNHGASYGSDAVGVEAMAGYPLGMERRFLPYLKVGLGDISGTGDVGGSEIGPRIGVGAEYRLQPHFAVVGQWMHQDADHITNDNFTVGLNYLFGLPQ